MKGIKKELIFITLGVITPLSLHTVKVNAGSFGAPNDPAFTLSLIHI